LAFDLILRHARIAGNGAGLVDIGIAGGRIETIQKELHGDAPEEDIGGRLVVPGLIETHIHLDKSDLLGRCDCGGGTLAEAVAAVAAAKRGFTEEDVYERARRTLEKAILHGTMRMRTHVEVDPRVGLTSFHALRRLKQDYAWAVDLQICAFPQEGLIDDPGCEEVLIEAIEAGADLVGGAPYMDRDSHGHIGRIFDIARRYDIDVDLHLDFSLDASRLDLLEVCRVTETHGFGGRVAIGHVSKISALATERQDEIGHLLAASGVGLTVLPSTDLFLMGRDHDRLVPRGVALAHRLLRLGVICSISTNNVLNPFTPFGDCSLVRMANLYANIAQIGTDADMAACLDMITAYPARLMRLADYGIVPGFPADIVVLDCRSEAEAIAEIAPVVCGYKGGVKRFSRPAAILFRPG
jgi:cytosine deaminase